MPRLPNVLVEMTLAGAYGKACEAQKIALKRMLSSGARLLERGVKCDLDAL
jgi:hypothetical protein